MSKKIMKLIKINVISAILISLTSTIAFAQSNTLDAFQQEVFTHMQNMETSFTLNYTGDSTEFLKQASTLIRDASKPDDYLNILWLKESATVKGTPGNLDITLNVSYIETKEQVAFVDNKINEIIASVITPGMTDIQKAKALHDYVCSITTYDFSLLKISDYTALTDSKTVCRGYAMLLYKLYTKADIPVHILVGTIHGTSHSWNLVQLNGKWYHIDATNDDANNTTQYYGLSDANATSRGFVWTKGALPVALTNLVDNTETIPVDNVVLTNATKSVTNAETLKTQANVDIANKLIALLTDGVDKTSLQQRLSIVQLAISQTSTDAITIAMVKAESSLLLADISNAEKLINTLPTGDTKTGLLIRLQNVKLTVLINTATTAVVKAEKSLITTDISSAEVLVTALSNGDIKNELTIRIQTVKQRILINNATIKVALAEQKPTQSNIDIATKALVLVFDGVDKTNLTSRIQAVSNTLTNNAINAITISVTNAEKFNTQGYIDTANRLISTLPNGDNKTLLTSRVKVVQQSLYLKSATNAVILAERTNNPTNITIANTLIAKLDDSNDKTTLINRLNSISSNMIKAATDAVVKAETSVQNVDEVNAEKLVTLLPNGPDKTALTTRLNVVKQAMPLINATNAVITAESTKTQYAITLATNAINLLSASDRKTALQLRLNIINQSIISNNVTTAVVNAEKFNTQGYIDTANRLISTLPNGDNKTLLTSRVKVVQQSLYLKGATNAVVLAERINKPTNITVANILIAKLIDSSDKTALINRINAIKK